MNINIIYLTTLTLSNENKRIFLKDQLLCFGLINSASVSPDDVLKKGSVFLATCI